MAGDSKVGALPLLIAWALTAAALVARALATAQSVPLILDTDDAMRLTMVHDLLAGQNWFDVAQHRLNAPFGALMHWSRLIDLPEAIVLLIARPLFGANADTVAAYAWPLLLLGGLLWLTAKLALRLGGRRSLWPALLLPAFSLVTMAEFAPGRLDHHSAQILLALGMLITMAEFAPGRVDHHSAQILLALGMLICTIAALDRPRFAVGAGIAAGVALSIGIEALPIVGATVMAFGLAWVASESRATALRDFGLSFALTTTLGLAQGVPPERWFVPATDATSFTYALAALLCGAAFLVMSLLPLRTAATRGIAGVIGGGAALALVVLSNPAMLRGPYGQLDPWLLTNWINRISEAEPWLTSLIGEPVYAISVAVPVLTGLGVIAWNIVRQRDSRAQWLVYGLILTIAFVVMLLQIRAARFAVPLAIPACALLVGAAWQRMVKSRGFTPIFAMLGSAIVSSGIVVAVLGTIALAAFPDYEEQTADTYRAQRNACLMPAAFTDLAGRPPEPVMTPIDLGSHILLFTPHSVVAAPYHRNQQGLLDTFRFFNGPIEEGRTILRSRGISLVVICPAMKEIRGLVDHTPDSFVTLFAEGKLPSWLHEVSPPGAPLKVYSVEP